MLAEVFSSRALTRFSCSTMEGNGYLCENDLLIKLPRMFPKGTDLMLYKIVFNTKALLLIFARLLKNALYTAEPWSI